MAAASQDGENREADNSVGRQSPPLLRILVCGEKRVGKSTLVSRLVSETQNASESQSISSPGNIFTSNIQSPPMTGERFQFAIENREFIITDFPSDESHTSGLAAVSSTSGVAIVLVDPIRGITNDTRRHSFVASLFGLRQVVLAVNNMDMTAYSQVSFEEIVGEYLEFAATLPNPPSIQPIPLSALNGDNLVEKSAKTKWFDGPPLLTFLETVDVASPTTEAAFAMPIASTDQKAGGITYLSGTIIAGSVKPGDAVKCLPDIEEAKIEQLMAVDGELDEAVAGQSVSLVLDRKVKASPGDVVAASNDAPEIADQFETTLLWMSEQPMLAGRAYDMKIGALTTSASITSIKHRVDINSMAHEPATQLNQHEIAQCNISLTKRIAFRPYLESRELGGFVLVDRLSGETVGMGLINFALRRSQNIHIQALDVDRGLRASIKDQKPVVLWFTGLSGSGKSTVANLVESYLVSQKHHTVLLDGDNVRHGLNRDLGFTDADRVENIRRIGEVSRLMADAGLIALVSFISPFMSERRMAREMLPEGEFIEIHISTPLEVAEQRDVKGLYKKARRGEIKNFTGIESPYEEPENAEITIDTSKVSAEHGAELIIDYLRLHKIIN